MINVEMTNEEYAVCKLSPKWPLDGAPLWTVENDGGAILATLEPADDGLSCKVPSSDTANGTGALVIARADAKQGPDVVELTETFVFTINAPMSKSLNGGVEVFLKVPV
jgi:hypothetical protein